MYYHSIYSSESCATRFVLLRVTIDYALMNSTNRRTNVSGHASTAVN